MPNDDLTLDHQTLGEAIKTWMTESEEQEWRQVRIDALKQTIDARIELLKRLVAEIRLLDTDMGLLIGELRKRSRDA